MTDLLLTPEWQRTLLGCTRLVVAYSGGLDSSVLLHAVHARFSASLPVLAVHVNHGISPNAQDWQHHCQSYCERLNIPLMTESVVIETSSNLENEARNARYGVFRKYLGKGDGLIMAHHAFDQAETVLLHLFRGAGIDGLAAISEAVTLGEAMLYRPLLHLDKKAIEDYALRHQIPYVEDESNADTYFNRNYIRQELMPLITERWPSAQAALARTAAHCQQAKRNLASLAHIDLGEPKQGCSSLDLGILSGLSQDRRINALRYWLVNQGLQCPAENTLHRIVCEVIEARADASPCVAWSSLAVRRYQNRLYLTRDNEVRAPQSNRIAWSNFPVECTIPSMDQTIMVVNPPDFSGDSPIDIRYRQGGEQLYWRGHHRSLKKLMQVWQIPPWERNRIPLIYANDELLAVAGYAVSDHVSKECQFIVHYERLRAVQ